MTRHTLANWLGNSPATWRLIERMDRGRGEMRWLDQLWAPAAPRRVPDLSGWDQRRLSAVWIGHATVLLRIGGLTLLTDPVFSNRIGLGAWLGTLGPRRHIAAALPIRRLPKLDLILISHAHFDHLDRPTLAGLCKKTPVITAAHTADLIRDLGFRRIVELPWGQQHRLDGLTLTARPVVHWGARTLLDRQRGFNAYLIESPPSRVLFGGDTAYHDGFRDVGKVDLAILGIGGYDPYVRSHATPEQAWAMADHVRADFVVPVHHSTFRLSQEPMHEPIQRLLAAAGGDAGRLAVREVGQTWIGPH